ncbi:MAG TPA: methyltransferase domain-containing protein, partial [Kofleriaceae bacterium]|nr:methyltransferase domain-containing protein [Kofleriaceae bacterium]
MDGDRFRRASLAIWERMAPGWDARHAWMEATARPVIDRMLDRLAPGPGDTVLDLAAGSGVVGFAAASLVAPGGRVIVSDFSPRMVEAAARQAAALGLDNAEARVLDAERLALPDAAVDGVLCRWGFMLMGDPAAALREARRVLRTGGRIAFAVFGAADDNPWVTLPTRVLEDLGHAAPREPGTPGILALADAERLAALVAAAGFTGVVIEPVAFSWQFR